MKVMVLLFLSAIVIAQADVEIEGFYENGCPKDTSVEKLLPHDQCDQFYQCFHGALVSRFCPSGLHFNADLEKCDWHGEASCLNKRSDNKRPDPSEELDASNPKHAFPICLSPDSNGVLVAHENCNEFYKCSYGKPVALKCANDLLYNPVNEKCDWPHNVDCSDRIVFNNISHYTTVRRNNNDANVIEDSYPDPNQATALCEGFSSEGLLVAHENCNQFYKCSGGKPVAMKCPANLLFNAYKEYCDWPRNVDCNERTIPENEKGDGEDDGDDEEIVTSKEEDFNNGGNDDPSQAATICNSPNSEGVLVAHEKCNQFYKCSDGNSVTFSCPGTLLFNPSKNYCDWPVNVECGQRVKPDGETNANGNGNDNDSTTPSGETGGNNHLDPNLAHDICRASGSDGVLVAHENCNSFYKCHDSRPVEVKCPDNLLYNPVKEYCDWSTYVECGDRTMPEKETDNDDSSVDNEGEDENPGNHAEPSQARRICAAANSDGILVAHENCNQFYKCFEGKPVALFCQLNLFYNPKKEYCDWPHNVNCGKRVIPGDNNGEDESYIANSKSSVCYGNPDGSIVPHENCSQFYKCVSGQTYPMDCPPGLYYNTILKVCDWPMNVNCGERLSEQQALKKARRAVRLGGVRRF